MLWFPRLLLLRYLMGGMLQPLIAAIGGGTILLTAGRLFELADQLIRDRTPPLTVLQLLLLDIPDTMVLAMPIAALFATMLTLGRLSANSEVTALRSVGISYRQIFAPILLLGLLVSGVAYGINDGIMPLAKQRIRTLDRQIILADVNPRLNQDVFFKTRDGLWFFIRSVEPQRNVMRDVTILDINPDSTTSRFRKILLATEANWDGTTWLLRDGVEHVYDAQGALERPFETYPLAIGSDLSTLMLPAVDPKELTSQELWQQIQDLAGSNLASVDLRTELHLRFSLPLASFFAVLIAMPMAIQSTRQIGRYGGIVVAILLIFVYYILLNISRSLGEAGAIEPWLAGWSHNIVFGGVGMILLLRFWR